MDLFSQKLKELHARGPSAKILDVGGWFAPCRLATDMLDIMPFETLNREAAYGPGELRIEKARYIQADLGKIDRLPYPDKSFDFVVCRHTLEDIANPVAISKELVRVAKAGYLETPHRVYESTRGVERPWWAGHYHHRWLVEMDPAQNKITFQFKPHNLHHHPGFSFWCPPWRKVLEPFKNTGLLWENTFAAEERVIIDYREVQQSLREFKRRYKGERLLRWRFAES